MLNVVRRGAVSVMSLALLAGFAGVSARAQQTTITATVYNSHFPEAAKGGEAWNGVSVASNGNVYYVLDSPAADLPAIMYEYNPKTKTVSKVADLNEAVGQKPGAIVQGKSHVTFVEDNGKLYFSTHLGYYQTTSGVEGMPTPPPGMTQYPGGHFVSYDLKTKKFEDLGLSPGEGIITFAMDKQRQRLYGITWPTGYFLRLDLKTKELKNLGTQFHKGEIGKLGDDYRSICRRIIVDPRNGSAYFTTGEGTIFKYSYASDAIAAVPGVSLKKDYFGQMDPTQHGMAYNWRSAQWDPVHNVIYGINGRTSYLFKFDPDKNTVEVLDRIASEPSKQTGMYDRFEYGYMGFNWGPDGHTLYYLTGAPLPPKPPVPGQPAPRRAGEGAHLVTYDTANGKYVDHGLIMLDNGTPSTAPQGIAIAADGTVYTMVYVTRDGKRNIELISLHP